MVQKDPGSIPAIDNFFFLFIDILTQKKLKKFLKKSKKKIEKNWKKFRIFLVFFPSDLTWGLTVFLKLLIYNEKEKKNLAQTRNWTPDLSLHSPLPYPLDHEVYAQT